MRTFLFAAALLALPGAAFAQAAQPPVTLKSSAFIVKQVPDGPGKTKNTLVPTVRVLPGNVIVIMLDYRNPGTKPASGFVINNPVPKGVEFTGVEQKWAIVSVDGGKNFGPLATLKVKTADGSERNATMLDVTAIRWTFAQPIPAGAGGKVQFYGVVK
jgi:hypothetical protein